MSDQLRDRIEELRFQLDTAESAFLRQSGWDYTSSTPDCVWRWVKKRGNGIEIMTNKADALRMEGIT